jgi:arylsulfatase A-like enzyme
VNVGFGHRTWRPAYPGYRGVLREDTATIARILRPERLRDLGLRQVAPECRTGRLRKRDRSTRWPTGAGFDKFYGFLGGETDQWEPTLYDGTTPVERRAIAGLPLHRGHDGQAVAWMQMQRPWTPRARSSSTSRPAPRTRRTNRRQPGSRSYRGKFDQGWDRLREETLARQIEAGHRAPGHRSSRPSPPRSRTGTRCRPTRSACSRARPRSSPRIAEYTDHEIGRMLEAFDDVGQADNTLVFYIAGDNGTSGEGGANGMFNEYTYFNGVQEKVRGHAAEARPVG